MSAVDVVAAAFYAILNMCIPLGVGFVLQKLDVLTKESRKVVSNINYYALVPIYGLIFTMRAIDRNRLQEFGLVMVSSFGSWIIGFLIILVMLCIVRSDIRYRFSLAFVTVCGSVVVMPEMIGESTCAKGGKYVDTFACKNSLVKPYASLPLVYCNILYWVIILPLLQSEQRIALETRKIFAFALNYYASINDFIADTTLTEIHEPKFDEMFYEEKQKAEKEDPNVVIVLPEEPCTEPPSLAKAASSPDKDKHAGNHLRVVSGRTLLKEPISLTSERFIEEYFDRSISSVDYANILTAFERLEGRAKKNSEHRMNWQIITENVVEPAGLLKKLVPEKVLSWKFLKERILMSPPAICAVLGVVLGFIFPLKEWLFDVNNKPLPTFIGTVMTLGGMMTPNSLFILGASIAEGVSIRRDAFIRWGHVLIANVLRFIILPLMGLLWVFVAVRQMYPESFTSNPVLMLVCYTFWVVPNGVVLIAVYGFAEYFTLEFGILSVYLNIVAAPMMVVFLVVYFLIYESY